MKLTESQPEAPKAEPKFKAGDKVHVNDAPYGADMIGFHSKFFGTDGEVKAMYEPGYFLVQTSLGVGLYHENSLTLWTTPQENTVPEVGDYVRITRAWTKDDVHATYAAAMFPHDETIGKVGRYTTDWDKLEPVCMVLFPDGNEYMYPRAVVEKVSGPDETWKGKLDAYWPPEQAVPAPATESAPEPQFKPFNRVLVQDIDGERRKGEKGMSEGYRIIRSELAQKYRCPFSVIDRAGDYRVCCEGANCMAWMMELDDKGEPTGRGRCGMLLRYVQTSCKWGLI